MSCRWPRSDSWRRPIATAPSGCSRPGSSEPTNHLSLALATELEEALSGYPGAVVVAGHDRWLRRRWAGASLAL